MSLSHDDVVRIIQLLDVSQFDELKLEADGVKLSLRRNGAGDRAVATSASTPATKEASPIQTPPVTDQNTASPTDLIEVKAPMLGTFYGAPKPGAAAFVSVGAAVTKDTAIGIIEVMKLMNSVSAGVQGVVVDILVSDGELVEFDQVLMRLRPV